MPRRFLNLIPAALIVLNLACNGDSITSPTTGTLKVTTTTVGVDRDTNGYGLVVDGEPAGPIGASGGVLIPDLTVGEHTVSLGNMERNCTVEGEEQWGVLLEGGDTTDVVFNVTCGPAAGGILIRTATTGAFPDPDGYSITVDGAAFTFIPITGEVRISGVEPGRRVVDLGLISGNCVLAGNSVRGVEVVPGVTTATAFSVDCSRAPAIAFTTSFGISLINPDGTGLTRLLESGGAPVWSPDRSRIAFQMNEDLYSVRPDNTELIRLTTSLGRLGEYHWSPDGTFLAARVFDCSSTPPDCGFESHAWLIRADGSGATSLVDGSNPSWSPDGRTIAFGNNWDSDSLYPQDISIVETDGSNPRTIAQGAFQPQWSPDGSRIAFIRMSPTDSLDIWLMNPDGTGQVNLTQGRGYDHRLAWSPDGSKIAFNAYAFTGEYGNSAIGVMNADGTGRAMLTDGTDDAHNPVWSPDGSQIVFMGTPAYPGTDVEVYVIRAEGGVPVNVTHNPGSPDEYPDW